MKRDERRETRDERRVKHTRTRVICSVSSGRVGRSVGYECPKAEATLVLATVNVNILRSPH